MISTSWRALVIRKRLSTRSTTRRAAGHSTTRPTFHPGTLRSLRLPCTIFNIYKMDLNGTNQTNRVFLGQWPFSQLRVKMKKQNQAQGFFLFVFLLWSGCCEDEWVSLWGGALLLHTKTFLYTFLYTILLYAFFFLSTHLHRQVVHH